MIHIGFTPEVQQTLHALGFVHTHHPAEWEDTGGPESGPQLTGHNAYDEWSNGVTSVFVDNGFISAVEKIPPEPM